jgi:hypothetical protein
MTGQPQYWVVSPNVDGSGRCVEEWKDEIRKYHVAIMGWGPGVVSNKMGSRFAGIGDPSIQIGDVVLVGRSRTRREIVAVGIVNSAWWAERLPPHPQNKEVYLRHLEPFLLLKDAPRGVPLDKVLPHSKAMTELPLSLENPDHKKVIDWLDKKLKGDDTQSANRRASSGPPRQPDIKRRHQVESAAQEAVTDFYTAQHYRVDDVSANSCGWDLVAKKERLTLKVEVKGLSGTTAHAELTPNEYRLVKNRDNSYRLCIVTDALESSCHIQEFRFDPNERQWLDQDGNELSIEERIGAVVKG